MSAALLGSVSPNVWFSKPILTFITPKRGQLTSPTSEQEDANTFLVVTTPKRHAVMRTESTTQL